MEDIGIQQLFDKIVEIYSFNNDSLSNDVLISNERHKNLIQKARIEIDEAINAAENDMYIDIISLYITNAMNYLAEITGNNVTDDVIFSKIFKRNHSQTYGKKQVNDYFSRIIRNRIFYLPPNIGNYHHRHESQQRRHCTCPVSIFRHEEIIDRYRNRCSNEGNIQPHDGLVREFVPNGQIKIYPQKHSSQHKTRNQFYALVVERIADVYFGNPRNISDKS